jgi:MipA family protein
MKKSLLYAALCALVSVGTVCPTHADQLPEWELGAGVSALSLPDYRGSDESRVYALPVPYFIYRGDRLKVDREGLRGKLFNTDNLNLDLSIGASVPINSKDNKARNGMPNLDASLEIGPSLEWRIWQPADKRAKLELRMPLRAATTIGPHESPKGIGYVFAPKLNVDLKDFAGVPGLSFGTYVSALYASQKNHDYFYSVPAAYATANRAAYQAKGGYSGAQFVMGVSKRISNFWLGAFFRADSLNGAVIADSPLVKTRRNYAGGIGVSYVFAQSGTLVTADE